LSLAYSKLIPYWCDNALNWKQLINSLLLASSLLFAVTIKGKDATPLHWQSFNHAYTAFDRISSNQAQDGNFIATIDGSHLDVADFGRTPLYEYQPEGYLFQTINAKSYRNKHLHISAFARNIEPDFEDLTKQFENYIVARYELQESESEDTPLPDPYAAIASGFSQHIRDSYAQSGYGVWVLLHMPYSEYGAKVIRQITPTATGNISSPQRWHRFNVEVSIPKECEKITVVFWSRGVSIAQVDHFAIVEHGDALPRRNNGAYFSHFDGLYERVLKENSQTHSSRLENLSFETQ